MQENPYYWWYKCLNLYSVDLWKPKVRDALSDATTMEWDEFWESHEEHFKELDPFLMRVLEDKEEADRWLVWDGSLNEALLLVSLDYPVSTLMAELERQIKALKEVKRGRPVRESLAEFPLAREPNVPYIEKLVGIFQDRMVAKPPMKLVELAVKWNLAPQCDPLVADERNVMTASASRMVNQAKALVKNASQGNFPVY